MSVLSEIAADDYLKSIVKACTTLNKDTLTTGEVAKLLSVTPGTATMMIKKLQKDGYLEYKSYHGCRLTEQGKIYGLAVLRRHRLLESFLAKLFDMSDKEIHEEAEQIEHSVSEKLIDLIDEYLDFPLRDQSGAPIPKKNQKDFTADVLLANALKNKLYKIVRLAGTEGQNNYCAKMGLSEGIFISVEKKIEDLGIALLKSKDGKEINCPLPLLEIIRIEK